MGFNDYPVNVLAVQLLPAMAAAAISIHLVVSGVRRRTCGGGWRIAVGIAFLVILAASFATKLWRYRYYRLPEIYRESRPPNPESFPHTEDDEEDDFD